MSSINSNFSATKSSKFSNKTKLQRSNSLVLNLHSRNQTEWNSTKPQFSHQNSPSTACSKISSKDVFSLENICPIDSSSADDRSKRVATIMQEIKKEKPLGECQLYKMPLTYRSFVWAPLLDSLYFTQTVKTVKSSSSTPKTLLRSRSTQSLVSQESLASKQSKAEKPEPSSASNQLARKDIVRLNMLASARPVIKLRNQSVINNKANELSSRRSLKLGAVPKYLTSRKAEWARKEEELIKSLPDPDCPPGHVVMPENERLETLSQLQKNLEEMITEFNSLPVSKDTLRITLKRKEIEKQLTKVEEGIRILSKPKVFVRIDQ